MTGLQRAIRLAYILSAVALSGAAYSESATEPPAWPEVRPKRIGVPKAGAGRLITVQIKPGDRKVAPPPKPSAATPSGGTQPVSPNASADAGKLLDWYWSAVPHDLAGAGPERFGAALAALENDPSKSIPRPSFQHVTSLAKKYGPSLLENSIGTRVSPALALAVISVESAGNPNAVSHAGARGLMQLIPATAERFGVNPNDPDQNIKGGIAYLDWLLKEFNGDVVLALAGYNAGENAVKSNGGPPPYAETRAYVPKVLAAWQIARGLCITPPELYSDGCVFATNAVRASN